MQYTFLILFSHLVIFSFAQLNVPSISEKSLGHLQKAKTMYLCIPDTLNNYTGLQYKEALKSAWTNGDVILMKPDKKDSLLEHSEAAIMMVLEYKTPADKKRPLGEFSLALYNMTSEGNFMLGSAMIDIALEGKGAGNITPGLLNLYVRGLIHLIRHQNRVLPGEAYCDVKSISDTLFIPDFITEYYPEKLQNPKIVERSTADFFAKSGLKYKLVSNAELSRRILLGDINYVYLFTNFNRTGYAACYDVKKGALLYQAKVEADYNHMSVGKLMKCMQE